MAKTTVAGGAKRLIVAYIRLIAVGLFILGVGALLAGKFLVAVGFFFMVAMVFGRYFLEGYKQGRGDGDAGTT